MEGRKELNLAYDQQVCKDGLIKRVRIQQHTGYNKTNILASFSADGILSLISYFYYWHERSAFQPVGVWAVDW